ncbi:hypothetical protein BJ122_10617 [Rhodopseudomonas faecalis]|uniref:Uncharacterized protein n=1 Tax=Rhodopseudomonas faecalis TaxID=99655 RepID=A0A318TFS9_9BRAD|nr:hypothetical protein BJ122_10617 [Rhodopseudomonas faecalis]
MMAFEILLLSAAAVSTVVILFSVVIVGDIQDHATRRQSYRRQVKH